MRALSRNYRVEDSSNAQIEAHPGLAFAALILFGIAMALSSLAGAVVGQAPDLAGLLPAGAITGEVARSVTAATALVGAIAFGGWGWRLWQRAKDA